MGRTCEPEASSGHLPWGQVRTEEGKGIGTPVASGPTAAASGYGHKCPKRRCPYPWPQTWSEPSLCRLRPESRVREHSW